MILSILQQDLGAIWFWCRCDCIASRDVASPELHLQWPALQNRHICTQKQLWRVSRSKELKWLAFTYSKGWKRSNWEVPYVLLAAYAGQSLRGVVSGRLHIEDGAQKMYIAVLGVVAPFRSQGIGEPCLRWNCWEHATGIHCSGRFSRNFSGTCLASETDSACDF